MIHRIGLFLLTGILGASEVTVAGTVLTPGSTGIVTYAYGGYTRSARIHHPAGWNGTSALPIVLVLHGGGGTAVNAEAGYRMSVRADAAGFIAVYPDGLALNGSGQVIPPGPILSNQHWADDRQTTSDLAGIDDVGWLGDLLDRIAAAVAVDADRVYVSGMSNGGSMAHRLGRDDARRYAAIASVSGSYGSNPTAPFRPAAPVSVLQIHGTNDSLMPYAGGEVPGPGSGVISVEATLAQWRNANHIGGDPISAAMPDAVADGCTSTRLRWDGGDAGTTVMLIRVDGGSHSWPGASNAGFGSGTKTMDFSGTDEIWNFFSAHARQPEVRLSHAGVDLTNPAAHAISTPTTFGVPLELVYTISNDGGKALTVSAVTATAVTGCTVTLVSGGPGVVAAGASTTRIIRVTANAASWSAQLHIDSDDADEAQTTLIVSGVGTPDTGGGGSVGSTPTTGAGSSTGGGGCGFGLATAALLFGCGLLPGRRPRGR